MTNYIGLNLGPIYRTIKNVRKTRELWAASFLFSWIMKQVLIRLRDAKMDGQILTPYLDKEDYQAGKQSNIQAGIYSDRLIMQANPGDAEKLQKFCRKVIEEDLVEAAAKALKVEEEALKAFFQSYFQYQIVEVPFDPKPDPNLSDRLSNPMKMVNAYLDTVGQAPLWAAKEEKNWVWSYIEALNQSGGRWIRKSFGEKLSIKSIGEISTSDLGTRSPEAKAEYQKEISSWKESERKEEEKDLIENLKSNETLGAHFRTYHKYMAVVHADVDDLGKAIGELENLEHFQKYSKAIVSASKGAVDKIQDYGGLAIYVGGEDIVFFAPVFNAKEGNVSESIFHLADRLNESYQDQFKALKKELGIDIPIPTLSFGISITYYKYPLEEAMDLSRHLCDEIAKKASIEEKDDYRKNAIAFQIIKHSGQIFQQILWRKSPMYAAFKDLLEQQLNADKKAINSVVHSLEHHGPVLRLRAYDRQEGLGNIEHFFDNNFDESIHKKGYVKQFMHGIPHDDPAKRKQGVKHLIFHAYQDYGVEMKPRFNEEKDTDRALDSLYAILRSIHFLIQEDDE